VPIGGHQRRGQVELQLGLVQHKRVVAEPARGRQRPLAPGRENNFLAVSDTARKVRVRAG